MRRIIFLIISLLLLVSTIGFLLSNGRQNFQPLTLNSLLNALSNFDLSFSGVTALMNNLSNTVQSFTKIFSAEFSLDAIIEFLKAVFVDPFYVLYLLVDNLLGILKEVFELLNSLLQFR